MSLWVFQKKISFSRCLNSNQYLLQAGMLYFKTSLFSAKTKKEDEKTNKEDQIHAEQ